MYTLLRIRCTLCPKYSGIDKDNNLYPITHKCYPEQIRQPMTDEELHVFGVEQVLVYYHHQNGNIIKRNVNTGIEYPHIVMENKEEYTYFYVTVKSGIYPNIPKPLHIENYSTLIKLAEEANATPVFIGAVFSNYSEDDDNPPICGGDYIVKITRLKELWNWQILYICLITSVEYNKLIIPELLIDEGVYL